MLHLAQVSKKGLLGKPVLRLLARQRLEHQWVLVEGEEWVDAPEASAYGDGLLVVVDLNPNRQVLSLRDASDWVIKLVKQFLCEGITPAFLRQEANRVEQWRQSLTLQSQDLARRTVELETRRDQIQELEEKLKREKRMLQSIKAQFERSNRLES
jgi:hypothetical protein